MIYEVSTWAWLEELGAGTLADVPAGAWDGLALPGVDTVWLMGVWERSEDGRAVFARGGEEHVVGSPYCIRSYEADLRFGGRAGLAAARAELARRGLRLLLDFVPNHVAPDHPWVTEHPEYLVRGEDRDGFAYARDPYFPPWTDVLQLDPNSPGLRDAAVATLLDVAEQCDGVRCDMAMLMLDDVSARTWGDRVSPPRPQPYWVEVVGRVRAVRPDFLFVAEAYWDLEATLLEQGIDLCYDKRLYDRLVHGDAGAVRDHLRADPAWQRRLVRFLENHDEPRAAAVLPAGRLEAAALVLLTAPGTVLLHEGQLEGRRVRLPVHVGRRPDEAVDPAVADGWRRLLALTGDGLRNGRWELLDAGHESLLAWRLSHHLVVVNYGDREADGRIRLPDLAGGPLVLVDVLDGRRYERDGGELATSGLYVQLAPYGAHLFRIG